MKPVNAQITPHDNLLLAFRRQDPAWIPWIPYIGGVNTPGFVPEDIKRRQDFLEIGCFLQDHLGCDVLIAAEAVDRRTESVAQKKERQGDHTVEEWTVAGRTLRRVHQTFAYGDQDTSANAEYPLKTVADLQTLGWLMQDQTVQPCEVDFIDKRSRLGSRGLVYANGPRTPLMALLIDYAGLENYLTFYTDNPGQLETLVDLIHQANLAEYRALAQTEVEVIGTFEDFDTMLINPRLFNRYVLPCLREYSQIIHAAGKFHMVHSCGHIRHFLPGCLEIGYDAHNYLASPPVGNTPIVEARRVWGEQINIMAAVDPVLLERGSSEQVSEFTRQMLDDLGSRRAMMVMTSSKPTIPEANLQAVAELIR